MVQGSWTTDSPSLKISQKEQTNKRTKKVSKPSKKCSSSKQTKREVEILATTLKCGGQENTEDSCVEQKVPIPEGCPAGFSREEGW